MVVSVEWYEAGAWWSPDEAKGGEVALPPFGQ